MNKQQKLALIKTTCQEVLTSVGYDGRYVIDVSPEAPVPCVAYTHLITEEIWGNPQMLDYQHYRDTEVIFIVPEWFLEDDRRWEPEMLQWVYAHECGHAFLGHTALQGGTDDFIRQEKEADAFASTFFPGVVAEEVIALLMYREVDKLAPKYNMSAGEFYRTRSWRRFFELSWTNANRNRINVGGMMSFLDEYVDGKKSIDFYALS